MVGTTNELERGRESYAGRAWTDAYESLSHAHQAAPLGADDAELLATSAYMLGLDDEHVSGLERAHHRHLDAGDAARAVRCAFWLGINLALRREMGRASGWFGRAQRVVDREGVTRFPATSRRCGTCWQTTPRARSSCSRAPAAWGPWAS